VFPSRFESTGLRGGLGAATTESVAFDL